MSLTERGPSGPRGISVQLLSHVRLFATLWTAARQASLSITDSRNLPKIVSLESVMPSSHLILCCPLLFSPSIFPSIGVFSKESALGIRWPKYRTASRGCDQGEKPRLPLGQGLGGVSRRRVEFLLRPPGGLRGQAGPAGAASPGLPGKQP